VTVRAEAVAASDLKPGLGEFGRIAALMAPLAAGYDGALGLGDDAALIAVPTGRQLVTTVDALVEGVHFLPEDAPELVARKLLRVNLSDLAAMAAEPLGYLLTLALPKRCDDDWVRRFAAGLAADQAAFGIHLMGGDSVSTPGPVTLTVTAFGTVAEGRALRRNGARPGDLVFVSGTIGDGALGLLAATWQLADLASAHRDFLADRYRLPCPRVRLGPALAGHAHALMDISDGLVADLGHIARQSGVAAVIEAVRVPLSAAAVAVLAETPERMMDVLTGGDDYELLLTAPPDAADAVQRLGQSLGVPVTPIGRIEPGSGVRVLDGVGDEIEIRRPGWAHV
jgi:thiamine-monophosphate kinase